MKTIQSKVFEVEFLFNDLMTENEIKSHLKKYSKDVYVDGSEATILLSLPPEMNDAHIEVEIDSILDGGKYGSLVEYFEV